MKSHSLVGEKNNDLGDMGSPLGITVPDKEETGASSK